MGERYKLTQFIAENKQELLQAYSKLTAIQKQVYNNAIMTARARKVPVARSNPKIVSRVVSSAFAKMDQEVSWFIESSLIRLDLHMHSGLVFVPRPVLKVFTLQFTARLKIFRSRNYSSLRKPKGSSEMSLALNRTI